MSHTHNDTQTGYIFDTDSDFAPERWIARLDKAYQQSYSEGRGIKRLLCFVLGGIVYFTGLILFSIIALLILSGYWLVLPKDEYEDRFGHL